jgi:hypothetical protein
MYTRCYRSAVTHTMPPRPAGNNEGNPRCREWFPAPVRKTNSILLDSVGASASDVILNEAKACSADLVVMGTHGRRGLARLVMGSDAEAVVRTCAVPVLLVHGQTRPKAVMPRAGESSAKNVCEAPR